VRSFRFSKEKFVCIFTVQSPSQDRYAAHLTKPQSSSLATLMFLTAQALNNTGELFKSVNLHICSGTDFTSL